MRKVLTVLWYTRPKFYLFIKTKTNKTSGGGGRETCASSNVGLLRLEDINYSCRFYLHYKDTPIEKIKCYHIIKDKTK